MILLSRVEAVLQDLTWECARNVRDVTSAHVRGQSGRQLTGAMKKIEKDETVDAGRRDLIRRWSERYATLNERRNTMAHSLWYQDANDPEALVAWRQRRGAQHAGDAHESNWTAEDFVRFERDAEDAYISAVNDLLDVAGRIVATTNGEEDSLSEDEERWLKRHFRIGRDQLPI